MSNEESDEIDHIYELTITRNRSGSIVDFEIDFVIKPVYFYHRALLIRILKSFTSLSNNSSEELKLKAWDKFDEVREQTNTKIQSTLLNTTNTINGLIQSPKLILPFSQNNDLNTPAYVLCLGNLSISRDADNAYQKNYEYVNISIKGTQLQYFDSLIIWKKYELDSIRATLENEEIFNCLNDKVFNVIEELEIYFKIGKKLKQETYFLKDLDQANMTIEGKVSDVRVNMTSQRYNSLINFNKMIEISGKNLTSKIMLHEKQDILNAATKTGIIRKRGATIQYWTKQYAVLSGSYLYFYNEDIDESETYESWFYLKDANVDVYEEDEELQHVFYIMNDKNHFFIYANDEETRKAWIKEIRSKIYEINNIIEDFGSVNIQQEGTSSYQTRASVQNNPEAKMLLVDLKFENLEYTMYNDKFSFNKKDSSSPNYSKFLNLQISGMTLSSISTTKVDINPETNKVISYDKHYSIVVDVEVAKIKFKDIPNNILLAESNSKMSASIKILDKASKLYKGDSLQIIFDFDTVSVNFIPESIKKMVTFFLNTSYKEDVLNLIKSGSNREEVKHEFERKRIDSVISAKPEDDTSKFEVFTSKSIMKL
jgi:hypothetical protein